jgi:hypothetical protein
VFSLRLATSTSSPATAWMQAKSQKRTFEKDGLDDAIVKQISQTGWSKV